jgi:hypothetical protein
MGSTEPPPMTARTDAQDDLEMKNCATCGLPYDDSPYGFGTAGCPECDPTLRIRAARRTRRAPGSEPEVLVA